MRGARFSHLPTMSLALVSSSLFVMAALSFMVLAGTSSLGESLWEIVLILATSTPPLFIVSAELSRLLLRAATPPKPTATANSIPEIKPPLIVPVIIRRASDVDALRICVDNNLHHVQRLPIIFLIDLPDTDVAHDPGDEKLLSTIRESLAERLAAGTVAILTRRRRYDPVDRVWRGWERKRGKIEEFCRLARGDTNTSFDQQLPFALRDITEFVTIDIDTQLTPKTVEMLVRACDHKAAIICPTIEHARSVSSTPFEILQAPLWGRRFADPRRTFNQSRLGYDIYYGKGLIVIDRFLERTDGRIAERTILSHDHLESMLAGAISTNRAIVHEPVPTVRRHWARRQHRWMRGDFQIVPWIFGRDLSFVARFHLLEIVLSQLIPLGCILTAAVAMALLPWPSAGWAAMLAIALIRPGMVLLPLQIPLILVERGEPPGKRVLRAMEALITETSAWILAISYVPRDALLGLHAAIVVAWRLCWTGRDLLTWNDANEGDVTVSGEVASALAGLVTFGVLFASAGQLQFVAGLLTFWFMAPLILSLRIPSFGVGLRRNVPHRMANEFNS